MAQITFGTVDLLSSPYFVYPDGDFGAGVVDTATVDRLLTDGEVVSGLRTSNRTITMGVEIQASSRQALAAAEVALAQQADLPSNTLTLQFGDTGAPVAGTVGTPSSLFTMVTAASEAAITSGSFTAPAGQLIVVSCELFTSASAGATTFAVSDTLGLSWTQVAAVKGATGNLTMGSLFYATGNGATGTVTVTPSRTGATSTAMALSGYSVSGAAGVGATGVAASGAVALSGVPASNSLVFALLSNGLGSDPVNTVPAGHTGLFVDQRPSSASLWVTASYKNGGAAQTSTFGGTLTNAASAAIEILAAPTANPADGMVMVADTFRAQLVPAYDYFTDRAFTRAYTLTVPALPFLRSPDPITLSPSALTAVQIDSFDTAPVGWTQDTVTFVQGTASARYTFSAAARTSSTITASKTGTWNLSGLPYVYVDNLLTGVQTSQLTQSTFQLVLASAGGSVTFQTKQIPSTFAFGVVLFDLSSPVSTTGTFSAAAVTSYALSWTFTSNSSSTGSLRFDDLGSLTAIGAPLSGPQGVVRFSGVKGAARTPASFTLAPVVVGDSASRVMIATSPGAAAGFNPLFPISTSAGTAVTTDATALSGSRSNATANNTWNVTASSYSGAYVVWARVKASSLGSNTVTVSAGLNVLSPPFLSSTAAKTQFTAADVLGTTRWSMVPLGVITVPPVAVSPTNTVQKVTLKVTSTNTYVDSVYLVDTAGQMLMYDTQDASNIVFLSYWFFDAPSGADQVGKAMEGSSADRSDAVSIAQWVRSDTVVNLSPGDQAVLVVADQMVSGANVTVTYYPRYLAERPS